MGVTRERGRVRNLESEGWRATETAPAELPIRERVGGAAGEAEVGIVEAEVGTAVLRQVQPGQAETQVAAGVRFPGGLADVQPHVNRAGEDQQGHQEGCEASGEAHEGAEYTIGLLRTR